MAKPPKGHKPKTRKRLAWPYCQKCGLLYLKNDATKKALREPCEGDKYDDQEDE